MRLLYPHTLFPLFSSSKLTPMTTQTLFHSTPFSNLQKSLSPQRNLFHHCRAFFTVFCAKPISKNHPSPLRTNGYYGTSHANVPRPVHLENPEENTVETQFGILKKKLEVIGIETGICVPGQYNYLLCPKCQGGHFEKRSLSLYIAPDGASAAWACHRGKCGWKGRTQLRKFRNNQVTPVLNHCSEGTKTSDSKIVKSSRSRRNITMNKEICTPDAPASAKFSD